MTGITIEPITPRIGAYVKVSPDDILKERVPDKILDALGEYGVLVFPQIHLSDEAFVELTNRLGSMEAVRRDNEKGTTHHDKGIYQITLDKDDKTQREFVMGNDFWHMDGTAYKVPGKATLLKCESPASSGGDTGFANLVAAYEALPDERRRELESLRVRHCLAAVGRRLYEQPTPEDFERWNAIFPPTEHPLIWKQDSGKTSMVIGSTANEIVDMDADEGAALLEELLEWSTRDRFTYRHQWQKGDMVTFNNPTLLHRSHPYTRESGRVMHRTTIKGYEAFA